MISEKFGILRNTFISLLSYPIIDNNDVLYNDVENMLPSYLRCKKKQCTFNEKISSNHVIKQTGVFQVQDS